MREIHDHKVNTANGQITLFAVDEPGPGGASHHYRAQWLAPSPAGSEPLHYNYEIVFQNGPILEAGVNGLTHEVLLAILVDRLKAFQAGPYACRENALALTKLEEAQHWLHARTRARLARGVEGTHKV